MTSQIRRASVSVAANIAEGYGRENTGSYLQFLRIAQGSLKELETLLELSIRVGLAAPEQTEPLLASTDDIGRMLRALLRSIEASAGS
jgi:four helix bundle protein